MEKGISVKYANACLVESNFARHWTTNKDQITSEGIAMRADIVCMYLRGRVIYDDELRWWLLSLFGRVEFGEHL